MTTSDAYSFSDLILGRIDAFRANVNGLVEGFARRNEKGKEETQSTGTTLQQRLERAEQNMVLLDNCGPRFEASTNVPDERDLVQRNLLLELQWKRDIHEKGSKAIHAFREHVGFRFPDLERINGELFPGAPPTHFVPRCPKRQRVGLRNEKPQTSLDEILSSMEAKYPGIEFSRKCTTRSSSRHFTSVLKCKVNNELVVYISFSPHVPNSELSLVSTPNSSSTPASPSTGLAKSVKSVARKNDRRKRKKKEDMAAKVKQAAQDASKIELDDYITRMNSAYEAAKECEIARLVGMTNAHHFDRLVVYSASESAADDDAAWGASKHQAFVQITQHAREAMSHYIMHFPDTSLQQFLGWISLFSNVFQTTCAGCKKILARDSSDAFLLPPTFRAFTANQTRAFHPHCLTDA